jgi:hypothetical protein
MSDSEKVTALIKKLKPSLAEAVGILRTIILDVDKEIADHVKWNSPAFYYSGEMKPFNPKEYKRDIAVMNLNKGYILLILPTGANIKDSTGLLEGDYKDGRRMITLKDAADVKSKEKQIRKIIKDWLNTVEK